MPEVTGNPQMNIAPNPTPAAVPQAPKKAGRSFMGMLIAAAALLVAALAIWIGYKALTTTPSSTSPTTSTTTTVSEIKSDADFQKLEDELNNTDVDALTKDLDQNDTDAASF